MKDTKAPPINDRIRATQVQLITHDGRNIGTVSRHEAQRMADDAGLDLVQLSDVGQDGVPVVKIMDFGKVLYERKKKASEAKKHQKVIQVKEIKMRPKIGEHDYLTKMKQALQFLHDGKRVKFTLSFRGRENILKEKHGSEIFEKIDAFFAEQGIDKNLIKEADTKLGQLWSRIYYIKGN